MDVAGAAAAEPPVAPPPAVEGPIEYVGPDTYILLDAAGHPQPMLGMKYDDFVAAWKKSQNLDARSAEPHYVVESIRLEGAVRGDRAELGGEITVRQLVDAQVAVPLGMAGAILREQPRCRTIPGNDSAAASDPAGKADETSFIEFDRKQGGFVARLHGHKGDRCAISMPMLVPLVRDGNQTSLRLNLPQSAIGQMSLDVGTTIGTATVSSGSVLSKETTSQGSTRLRVAGLASDFQLTWSAVEQQHAELATVLSAVGNELVSIDGHSIRSDVRLTVRSYGGSFDRFRVRLPPGAQLIQEPRADATTTPAKYRVTLSSQSTEDDTPPEESRDAQIATVEFAEKQSGPVDVELSTEQALGDTGADRTMVLAGFEVLGAVRQYGGISVRVADNWQLRWDPDPYIRQVERTEQASTQQQLPTVALEYDRQPWSLRARLEPRPMRVLVTPVYNMELDADEARLHVQLGFQLPGARAYEFRVQLRGWELTSDPVESGGLVDQDAITVSRESVLILPLGQASSRRADVTFSLRRSLPRDLARLELPLPVPEADSVSAADLSIQTAADVELIPDVAHSTGLSPTPVTTDTPLPTFDDGRQVFRYRALLPEAILAASRTIRQREIVYDVATQLVIDRTEMRAAQTIDARVKYQALGQLTLDVPQPWAIVDNQVEIVPLETDVGSRETDHERLQPNGEELSTKQGIIIPVSAEGGMTEEGSRSVVVSLPQPRLGRFAVRVRYTSTPEIDNWGTGGLLVRLPAPIDGPVIKHELSIRSSPELSVRLDPTAANTPWQTLAAPSGADRADTAVNLVATESQPSVPLVIRILDRNGPQPAVVERIWLETWVAGSTIQDRAAFRFLSTGSAVTVELPPQASSQEVEALMDGRLADVSARPAGRLVIALPASDPSSDGPTRPHTLELRYRRPSSSGVIDREQLTPPQLVGTSPLSQTFWQLVLPADQQLLAPPDEMVPLDRWQWLGMFWGRRPTMSQSELENWASATNQLPPSDSQNEYLFGGFAPAASIEVVVVPRWLIVLAASGAVLAVAVGWIYAPRGRRAWVGISFAATLAALAIAYPTPAALIGQASILGLLAAAIAATVYRHLGRPATRPMISSGSTNLRMRASTRLDSAATPPLSQTPQLSTAASATAASSLHTPDAH